MMNSVIAFLVVIAAIGVRAQNVSLIQCAPPSGAQFTNISCPNGTYCVYDNRYDQTRPFDNQPIVTQVVAGLPIGCCPNNLPTACYPSRPLAGVMGCCPEFSTCCIDNDPYIETFVGCASSVDQCCGPRVCAPGYKCCDSILGACCPSLSRCANETELVTGAGATGDLDFCREPYNVTFLGQEITNFTITTNATTNLTVFNATVANTTYLFPRTLNETFPCGTERCYLNNTCVVGHANETSIKVVSLPPGTPASFTYFPNGTVFNITHRARTKELGCCPPNTTGCGQNPAGLGPYPAEYDYDLTDGMIGCAGPDEECCAPFICPAGMSCCRSTASWQGNRTNLIDFNLTLLEGIRFQQICCPTNTSTCCAVEVPSIFSNTNIGVLPYCGKGDSCDEPMFGLDSKSGLSYSIVGFPSPQTTVANYTATLLDRRANYPQPRFDCFPNNPKEGLGCGLCTGTTAIPVDCSASPSNLRDHVGGAGGGPQP